GAARRGARRREDEVHARPQGKAGQGNRAEGAGREGPPRDRRRGRRARAGHRRQGAGRGDEARPAVQAAPDRAAPARGRGPEGDPHQGRRGGSAGAPHRGERRSRGAAEARRRRGLPDGQGRQVERRADGPRRRAPEPPSAADPEDDGRQALRQGAGDHRRAGQRRRLRRRRTARHLEPEAHRARQRRRAARRRRRREGGAMSRRAEGERCEALHKSDLEPWTWRDVARTGITVLIAAVAVALATVAGATGTGDGSASARGARAPTLAIVVRDQTVLRAAPHASAQQQALLWQGDVVEVRGERIDHLQVWDHARERGGFIDASRVRRTSLTADETPELLALVRFVRDTPGSESLGIGFAAAALKSASAEALRGSVGAELFDAIGTMADRLAQRASNGAPAAATPGRVETALAAHLEA